MVPDTNIAASLICITTFWMSLFSFEDHYDALELFVKSVYFGRWEYKCCCYLVSFQEVTFAGFVVIHCEGY
jgi:hypothetical protein